MTRNANDYSYLNELLHIIENNFNRPLNISALAKAAGVSESKLQHDFPAKFGMTMQQYQTDIRVTNAKYMLTETTNSIKHIAEKVGYKNTTSFAHSFKKITGKRPSDYRNAENS